MRKVIVGNHHPDVMLACDIDLSKHLVIADMDAPAISNDYYKLIDLNGKCRWIPLFTTETTDDYPYDSIEEACDDIITSNDNVYVFDTFVEFVQWLTSAYPHIYGKSKGNIIFR